MARVWESDLPATDRLVLLSVADHADERDECYPSIGRLVDRTGLTDRSIQKAIKRLCEGGYLAVESGGGRNRTNLFRVLKPRTTFTPNHVHPETPNVVRVNPEPRSDKPSRTIIEPSEVIETPASVLSQYASADAVSSFIAYRRKSKGNALTLTAAKRLGHKLATITEMGGDASDALGMAEERGWLAVEPDWYFKAKGKPHGKSSRSQDRVQAFIAGARGAS